MARKPAKPTIPTSEIEYAESAYTELIADLDAARAAGSHQAIAALHRRREEAWGKLAAARAVAGAAAQDLTPERAADELSARLPLLPLAVQERLIRELAQLLGVRVVVD